MTLTLRLPVAPSTNHLYATVRGKRVKTRTARDYADEVIVLTLLAIREQEFYPPTTARFGVRYRLAFTNMSRDLDNSIKAAQDSIFAALMVNDRRIDVIEARRMPVDKLDPHCEVEVYVLEEA